MLKLNLEIRTKIISFFASIILHILFFVLIIISDLGSNHLSEVNSYLITLETVQYESKLNYTPNENKIFDNFRKPYEDDNSYPSDNVSISSEEIIADTTNLDQVYSESTLNLSIKYPRGWTYIDQNNKNKLDGVSFWSVEGIYNPPPYVHLEVVEKYLFNPNKFKYKVKQSNCEWYFNEPINLGDHISQEIYVRTEIDEDFIVKLIIIGEEQFRSFQPKFFAMLKSLRFGNRYLDIF